MTYDIKIFKSDSYQKILKAVLKFRYPKLSYEKALTEESNYKNCLYHASNTVCMRGEMYGLEFVNPSTIILARAITICELVDVLNYQAELFTNKEIAKMEAEMTENEKLLLSTFERIHATRGTKSQYWYRENKLFFNHNKPYWNEKIKLTNKYYFLHEQTQETIDEIAKLLD